VTRHSIVRSPARRLGSDRDRKGERDVTTMGEERPGAAVEVVLGVDTHLDTHVAVALDQLGGRLGAVTLPTTAKGYEELVSWAEGLGLVRCAGVEGTGSCGPDSPVT
jgi:hypothetical protein